MIWAGLGTLWAIVMTLDVVLYTEMHIGQTV